MTVAERMAARTAATTHDQQGTPCYSCGESALICQHDFVLTDEWCCPACRQLGAGQAHR